MNTYYLVRHGQDEDNVAGILNGHRDFPLTDLGRQQAHQLAVAIEQKKIKIDLILSSPLKRAFETAQILSSELNLPLPIIEPLLIERDFGSMTGKLISDIKSLCAPDILEVGTTTYFLSPPQAETFPELIIRAEELFKKLDQNYQDKNILMTTHGDMGKMLFCSYYRLNWLDVLKMFHFGNSDLLILSPNVSPENTKLITIKQFNL